MSFFSIQLARLGQHLGCLPEADLRLWEEQTRCGSAHEKGRYDQKRVRKLATGPLAQYLLVVADQEDNHQQWYGYKPVDES